MNKPKKKFRVIAPHFCENRPDYDQIIEAEDDEDAMNKATYSEGFRGYNDEVMVILEQ